MEHIFKTWLPTVSGRLSFSAIGRANRRPRVDSVNKSDGMSRYLICAQRRNLSDALLPDWLSNRWMGQTGTMWFVAVAHSIDHNMRPNEKFAGHLFLFHNEARWNEYARALVKEAQANLARFDEHRGGQIRTLAKYFDKTFRLTTELLTTNASFYTNFELKRNGETIIAFDDSGSLSEDAPRRPSTMCYQYLCSQLFFFLRDISHRHQHHDYTTDTVIDLHEIPISGDDIQWRDAVLGDLLRRVIANKRVRNERAIFHSSGIIGYAEAFVRVCKESLGQNDDCLCLRQDFSPLQTSLRAAQDELALERDKRRRITDFVRTTLLAVFGTLFSVASLLKLSKDNLDFGVPSQALVFIGRAAYSNTIYTMATCALLVISLAILTEGSDVSGWPGIRSLTRLLQPTSLFIQNSVIVVIICALAISLYLIL